MTTPFKNLTNNMALVYLGLMSMFVFGFGCNSSKPTPDPLVGFHIDALHTPDSNQAIADDYKDYIQKLSPEERKYVGPC